MATTSRVDTIVAYGDPKTEGFSWGKRLPALSSTIKTAVSRGISGQESGTVLRLGRGRDRPGKPLAGRVGGPLPLVLG